MRYAIRSRTRSSTNSPPLYAPAILVGIFIALRSATDFGASLARASVAQELAAQVIGVKSFELPGEPSGVDREIIGQLPSGFCVATRKSIARFNSGRSRGKHASDKAY